MRRFERRGDGTNFTCAKIVVSGVAQTNSRTKSRIYLRFIIVRLGGFVSVLYKSNHSSGHFFVFVSEIICYICTYLTDRFLLARQLDRIQKYMPFRVIRMNRWRKKMKQMSRFFANICRISCYRIFYIKYAGKI